MMKVLEKKLKCLNIELSKQKIIISETKNASQISEKRGSLCDELWYIMN